jgi:hypothetical protein
MHGLRVVQELGLSMQSTKSAMSRLLRLGKRSVLVALFAALVTSAVPTTTLAFPHSHIIHVNDGQGDSPLVP